MLGPQTPKYLLLEEEPKTIGNATMLLSRESKELQGTYNLKHSFKTFWPRKYSVLVKGMLS